MSTKRKLNYEDFDLVKFKIGPDTPYVVYYEKHNPGLGKQTVEIDGKIHDDLRGTVSALNEVFANRCGLLAVTNKLREEFKKTPKVLERLIELNNELVNAVEVTGCSFSGTGGLRKIIITGKIPVPGYGSYSLGCPGITIETDLLGYEEQVVKLCEAVKKEVYNYLFKEKRQPEEPDPQTSILDEEQQNNSSKEDLK